MITSEFIQKYYSDISDSPINNKRSPIITDLAKRSPFLLIQDKINNIDKINKEEGQQEDIRDKFLRTNHMDKVGKQEEEELI